MTDANTPHPSLQVGRAGRDGRQAPCFLFLDDCDYKRLRSLTFSGNPHPAPLLRLLRRVFFRPADAASVRAPAKRGTKAAAVNHILDDDKVSGGWDIQE